MVRLLTFLFLACRTLTAVGQADLPQMYSKYMLMAAPSRLIITTNQPKYMPGDSVWITVYWPVTKVHPIQSEIVNIQLIDQKGQALNHGIFLAHAGRGLTQIVLPDTLHAGLYRLAVYTEHMRQTESIHYKQFEVVTTTQRVRNQITDLAVEGKNLIARVPNRIVLRTLRPDASVVLREELSGHEMSLLTDSAGWASVIVTPTLGAKYTALCEGISFPSLLEAKPNGCSLHLSMGIDSLSVQLRSTQFMPEVTVVISDLEAIRFLETIKLNAQQDYTIQYPIDRLSPGESVVTVMAGTNVLATRMFRNSRGVMLKTNLRPGLAFHGRDTVEFELELADFQGRPLPGHVTVTVLNGSLFPSSLVDLGNDFSDIVASKPLPWGNIRSGLRPAAQNVTGAVEVSATLQDRTTGKPVPANTQVAFYLQQNRKWRQTFTDEFGNASWVLPEFYGEDDVVVFAERNKVRLSDVDINWHRPPVASFLTHPVNSLEEYRDTYSNFVHNTRVIRKSYQIYEASGADYHVMSAPNGGNISTLVEPDVTVNTDEYVNFPTMHELIKEIIPGVSSIKSKRGWGVRISVGAPLVASQDPLFLVDGMLTADTDYVMNLVPATLESVGVVYTARKLIPLGLLGRNGILIINTRKGQRIERPLSKGSFRVRGFSSYREFKRVGVNKSEPLFCSTLWHSGKTVSESGKSEFLFPLTDDVGEMLVWVRGQTQSGAWIESIVPFRVE